MGKHQNSVQGKTNVTRGMVYTPEQKNRRLRDFGGLGETCAVYDTRSAHMNDYGIVQHVVAKTRQASAFQPSALKVTY